MTSKTMDVREFRSLPNEALRDLAQDGKLIATACEAFIESVFPGAPPELKKMLRSAFFTGAHEVNDLARGTYDDASDPTPDDIQMAHNWQRELKNHRARIIGGKHGPH